MENLLVPYQAEKEIGCTRVLVLAPHPDDEVFGCGGAILRHVAMNIPVKVVIFSDGGFGESNSEEYILRRQKESIDAAVILGYGRPEFRNHPDRGILYGEKLVQGVLEDIRDFQSDLIYAPSIFEMHPDHRALGMAAAEALRRMKDKAKLALYEVGMPLRPNLLLDISDLAEKKLSAMQCFSSQLEKQRYDLDISALNRYRSYTLSATVTAAEAYILASNEELAKDFLGIYKSEHEKQREIGLSLDAGNLPLVSIIIRSMDRPTLNEALDSVALQTYPNIEVVLVNAKGEDHRKMLEWCGRFPLRFIESGQSLLRVEAANRGLDEAKGKYLAFLDDDDWFEPDHVGKLVQALENQPEFRLAYSGTRCVDGKRNALSTRFDSPFDSTRLLSINYIPIHAALFSRDLLEKGCKVDESLEVYEDWDFWIQASMHTDFLYVTGESAIYRISGESGFGVKADNATAQKNSLIVYRKWLPRLSGEKLLKMMSEVWQIQGKNENLAKKDVLLSEKDAQLSEKDAQLSEKDAVIGEIFSSTSWKITSPLRWISLRLRGIR